MGHQKKWDPRGAKVLLSPKSEPVCPEACLATPRAESLPAGQTRQGEDSIVSLPRGEPDEMTGEQGQMHACRTHGHGLTQKAALYPWDKHGILGVQGGGQPHTANKVFKAFI